jgi:hypothetical protein
MVTHDAVWSPPPKKELCHSTVLQKLCTMIWFIITKSIVWRQYHCWKKWIWLWKRIRPERIASVLYQRPASEQRLTSIRVYAVPGKYQSACSKQCLISISINDAFIHNPKKSLVLFQPWFRFIIKKIIRLISQTSFVCCSVLQCVAVCCSVLQCVAVCCSVLQCLSISKTSLKIAPDKHHHECVQHSVAKAL